MAIEQFEIDLERKGIPCEEDVLKLLRGYYDSEAYRVVGYDKEKDIVCPTRNKTFEVKNCQEAFKFVPVECEFNGVKSGINTSNADYWVFYCKEKFFIISLFDLRKILRNKQRMNYVIDGREVRIKLLSIDTLTQSATRIFLKEHLTKLEGKKQTWKL